MVGFITTRSHIEDRLVLLENVFRVTCKKDWEPSYTD